MGSLRELVLTPPMLSALQFIERYRHLTVIQVARVTGLKPKSASEMLLRMQRQGLLGFFGNVPIRGYGKTPKVYFLTRRGHALLGEELSYQGDALSPFKAVNRSARWSPLMYHRIATVDVMTALEASVRQLDHYSLSATFLDYRRRREGNGWISETADHVALPQIGENKIVPDAGFVLENLKTNQRKLFLIEVDRGTETLVSISGRHVRQSFRHKIEKYDRYLLSRRFRERYKAWGEFKHFMVLIITPSENRLQNMREILSDLPSKLHPFYRLCTLEECCENFFHDNWRERDKVNIDTHPLIRCLS